MADQGNMNGTRNAQRGRSSQLALLLPVIVSEFKRAVAAAIIDRLLVSLARHAPVGSIQKG